MGGILFLSRNGDKSGRVYIFFCDIGRYRKVRLDVEVRNVGGEIFFGCF